MYYLRKFTHDDIDGLYEALSDTKVVTHMATEGFTLEDCEFIVTDSNRHWHQHGYGSWAAVDKGSQKIIGWAGFKKWKDNEVEMLCVLSPASWGNGRAIMEDLIVYASQTLKFNEVYILLPHTRKSYKAIERYGFEFCCDENFNDEAFKKFKLVLE